MNKLDNQYTDFLEDKFWDHYSGLPSPMWYQYITELEDEEDNTNDSILDNRVNTEIQDKEKK